MIPCRYCEAEAGHEVVGKRGLKQLGRTLRDDRRAGRRYGCLDCGALLEFTTASGAAPVAFESWAPSEAGPVSPVEPTAKTPLRGRMPARWFGDWCAPAKARQSFWVRCDSVGTTLLPEVSVRDRSGAAVGLFTFAELATSVGATAAAPRRPRVFRGQPGAVERLLADPQGALEAARREGRPLLLDPRDLRGRIPAGRRV
jgi:hypothetical protein